MDCSQKIILGDGLEYLKGLPEHCVDLILTDCPYERSWSGDGGTVNNIKHLHESLQDVVDADIVNGYDIVGWGEEFMRVMKEPNIYLWASKKQIPKYFDFYVNRYKCKFDIIVWQKCLHSSTTLAIKDKKGQVKNVPIKDVFRSSNFTDIEVYDGKSWVKIQDIVPNNNVTEYVVIKLRDGNEIKCTLDHKFKVDGNLIEARNLKVGQVIDSTAIRLEEIDGPQGITSEMQWFIGHYIAEGNKGNRDNEISIATNTTNEFVKDTIIKVCKQYSATYSIYDGYGSLKSRTIHIRSKIIRGIIEEYVSGELAYGKHLSAKCWNNGTSFLNNVLKGYLDGDGNFDAKNERYRICFTGRNYNLMKDLSMACNILGYRITMRKGHSKCNGKKFRVFRGEIKMLPSERCKSQYEIISILKVPNGKHCFYDICLNNDNHMFALYDGVLSHNSNALPTYSNKYLSDAEYCLYFHKGSGKCFPSTYQKAKTVYVQPINHADKKVYGHPTIKPLNIIQNLVENSSREGQLVIDPFCGSGTTGVACKLLNRNFVGIDNCKDWVDLSNRRLKEVDTPTFCEAVNAKNH